MKHTWRRRLRGAAGTFASRRGPGRGGPGGLQLRAQYRPQPLQRWDP